MADLSQILAQLGRDGIDEVRLETGAPISVSQGGQLRPLTRHTITAEQVRQILRGTPLEPLLPKGDADGSPEFVMVDGEPYIVMIARQGGRLQLRFGRAPMSAPAGPSPSPAGGSAGLPRGEESRSESSQDVPWPEVSRETRRMESVEGETAPSPQGISLPRAPSADAPGAGRRGKRPRPGTLPENDARWGSMARPSPGLATRRSEPDITPRPSHPVTQPESVASWSEPPRSAPRPSPSPPPVTKAEVVSTLSSTGERPVVGELAELLRLARTRGASDVHVVADRPVSLRVGGRLTPRGEACPAATVRTMLEAIIPSRHATQLQERGYCDFAIDVESAGRFRVNVSRQRTGLKGCFRAVATVPPTLEQLGLPAELSRVTRYHQGLAVVSGPNGQGKTTTMAALVDLLNAGKPVHIITVEDPVEIVHPIKRAVISQREVGTHTRSFPSALKAALREDPDVIVIGELRDRETVEMALSAAETGHLVIATMSTPSGAKTITRLIDMFPPDDQAQVRATLAGALKIVVSQRLVPRADGQGLVAAAELITGNVPLWSLIRDDKLFQLPSLLQRGRAFGMIRIEDSLSALARGGVITEAEAQRHADDPQGLRFEEPTPEPAPDPMSRSSWRSGLRGLFDKGGS